MAKGRAGCKGKLMDFTTIALLPLLFGSVGLFLLYKLLQRLQEKAYVQDAVVVITGASSGLGKECAKLFHVAGARLILCGRDKEKLQSVVKDLARLNDKKTKTYTPHIVCFDLSDLEAVASSAKEILNCHGYVDILINNAGISYRGSILDTSVDVDREVMNTNYFGPVALTKELLPSMVHRKKGHIAVISSVQGKIAIPFRSAYAASKHATQAFFDCLRAEVEQHGVEVTVVSPGYIRTNLSVNAVTEDGSKYGVMDKTTAEGRDPADVALVVLRAVGQKKKEVLLAGLMPTLAVYFRTLTPQIFFNVMAARARKERKLKNS
ncbi:dehydrogenase/reductase SDR family member 7B isoform X2 [Protopterus annectens]|uniref:dehydrogenase/reductase SDR family member 7B isoform X2 n=1 Tax=Protopterus annectens TaxID=7888 RepID=UPI001CF93E5F|nr:dehydrogenase/reductase SDR family member 7B isoform X2 [Protopterus annectens]